MTHTPGPWGYEPGPAGEPGEMDDCAFLIFQSSADGEVLGAVYSPISDGEVKANARLIASAPELLEALEEIIRGDEMGNTLSGSQCVAIARAALAKVGT